MRRFLCALVCGVALTLLAAPTSDTAEAGWYGRGYGGGGYYGGGYRGYYGGGGYYRGYYGGRGYGGYYRPYYRPYNYGYYRPYYRPAYYGGYYRPYYRPYNYGYYRRTINRLTATTRPPTTRDIRTTAITPRRSIPAPDQRFTLVIASSAGSAGFSRQRSMNASLCL